MATQIAYPTSSPNNLALTPEQQAAIAPAGPNQGAPTKAIQVAPYPTDTERGLYLQQILAAWPQPEDSHAVDDWKNSVNAGSAAAVAAATPVFIQAEASGKSAQDAIADSRAAGSQAVQQFLFKYGKGPAPDPSTTGVGGTAAAGSGPSTGSATVTAGDKAYGIDQFRAGIASQQGDLAALSNGMGVNTPNARDTFHAIAPVNTTAAQVAPAPVLGTRTVAAPNLGPAAMQGTTAVAGTTLDTTQSDQSRAAQLANNADLQATAAGNGAAQQAYDARAKLTAFRSAQDANGLAQQARGSERKGALLQGMENSAQANVEGQIANEAQSATERQQAQGALSTAIAGTRSTDVTQATTQAQIEAQRNTLQAQLDSARAANDQAAINNFTQKLADLKAREQEVNAAALNKTAELNASNAIDVNKTNVAATNATSTANADRGVTVGVANNAGGLAANVAGSNEDVAQAKLKLDINKAIQDSAQGLLNEETRQKNITIAQGQLDVLNKKLALETDAARRAALSADRDFWLKALAALTTTVATAAPALAAVSDERVKVNIEKATPKDFAALAKALRSSWSTFDYKDGMGLPEGKQTSGMAQAIEKTKLGSLIVKPRADGVKTVDFGKAAAVLASYLISEKQAGR